MKYIIGGGMTGLVLAFYNQQYTVITDRIGGQFGFKFNLGARHIHDTPETRKLLSDLGVSFTPTIKKVGYCWFDHQIKMLSDVPPRWFRTHYYRKSRGLPNDAAVPKSVMSDNKTTIRVLDCNIKLVINKLALALGERLILDKIKRVNHETIFGRNADYNYERIVNTIPKPAFLRMRGFGSAAHYSKSVTFVKVEKEFMYTEDFDYVYCGSGYQFHRVSDHGEYLTVEFIGQIEPQRLKEIFKETVLDHVTLRTQVIDTARTLKIINTKFLGRYGEWKHGVRFHDVVKRAQEW